ncbi:MAG: pilus assembly protein, partial [Sphingomonas sp.]|nr:pilus assembly protein [Sphingomonas sp.]
MSGHNSIKAKFRAVVDRFGRSFPGARLVGDRSGAAAMEFALVATPLAALMVAILQTSLTFFAQQNLETVAEKSVRQLVTGQAQKANTTQAQFKTLVCSKLPIFMKCANVYVDVQSAASFSAANTAPPALTYDVNGAVTNAWVYSPQGAGSINVVRIMYAW